MRIKAFIHGAIRLGLWLFFVQAVPVQGTAVHEATEAPTAQPWVQDQPIQGNESVLSFSQPESAALNDWISDTARGQGMTKIPYPDERPSNPKVDRRAFSGLSPPQP